MNLIRRAAQILQDWMRHRHHVFRRSVIVSASLAAISVILAPLIAMLCYYHDSSEPYYSQRIGDRSGWVAFTYDNLMFRRVLMVPVDHTDAESHLMAAGLAFIDQSEIKELPRGLAWPPDAGQDAFDDKRHYFFVQSGWPLPAFAGNATLVGDRVFPNQQAFRVTDTRRSFAIGDVDGVPLLLPFGLRPIELTVDYCCHFGIIWTTFCIVWWSATLIAGRLAFGPDRCRECGYYLGDRRIYGCPECGWNRNCDASGR